MWWLMSVSLAIWFKATLGGKEEGEELSAGQPGGKHETLFKNN
jgi:hypothetical protein